MPRAKTISLAAIFLTLLLAGISCTGNGPENLGVIGSRLAPCPSSPNCVSSDEEEADQHVKPFLINGPQAPAWKAAMEVVFELPRTLIVKETPSYLHAECRSALFGFIDDLELSLRTAEGIIAVRSASRAGYSDLGVNRRRIETLRAALVSREVVR